MEFAIRQALNLTPNEDKVLTALMSFKWGQNVATIARKAGVGRTTALYILHRFEDRKIAKRLYWRYIKKNENLGVVSAEERHRRQSAWPYMNA